MDDCKAALSHFRSTTIVNVGRGRTHGHWAKNIYVTAVLGMCLTKPQTAAALQRHGGEHSLEIQASSPGPFSSPVLHRESQILANQTRQKGSDATGDVGPASPANPASNTMGRGSRFAFAFVTSTLGLGPQAAIRIHDRFNFRVGFSGFNYRRNVSDGDIVYDAALRLRSLNFLVDWFPTSKSLHVSPGLLVYDRNRVSANAIVPIGKVLSAGTEQFVSDPQNPISGTARSTIRAIAPMVLFGFGNLLPHTRHVGFSFDFGVVFQGTPVTTVTLAGSACDASQTQCKNIVNDRSIQADAEAGRKTMQDDLSILRFYPVISVGAGYRF